VVEKRHRHSITDTPAIPMSQTTILEFDADEVERHAQHARQAERRQPTFGQRYDPELRHDGKEPDLDADGFPSADEVDFTAVPAGLHLVKDRGIYLMSNAENYEEEFGEPPYGDVVPYAEEYGPDAAHEALARAVGGDDFCQFIPLWWYDRRPDPDVFRLHVETEKRRFQGVTAKVLEEA
jgi:hypothetical protein